MKSLVKKFTVYVESRSGEKAYIGDSIMFDCNESDIYKIMEIDHDCIVLSTANVKRLNAYSSNFNKGFKILK